MNTQDIRRQYRNETGEDALNSTIDTILQERTNCDEDMPIEWGNPVDKYYTIEYCLWLENKVEELSK